MNSHGQALIEYILMLIITVTLVLALISQIFKPFGQFIDSYMGSYVGCLLEYGELPTLGSSDPSAADEDSECNKKFAAATLEGGRPPGSGGGNRDSGEDANSKNSTRTSTGSGGSSGSSGGSYAGSDSRGGSSLINARRSPSRGTDGGAAKGGKVVEIAVNGSDGNGFFGSDRDGRRPVAQVKKTRAVGLAGLSEAERKKLEKKANGVATIIASDGIAPMPKKTRVKKPPVKAFVEEEKPLTVGNFIRYLFIAALVIALVIFIGGQALQMSKSYDK